MIQNGKRSLIRDASKDRRIRRTHRLLKQGLAELLSEKDFSDISVRDIAERADVNRSTFYLHYSDTHDLLQKLETDTLNDIQEMIDAHAEEFETKNSLIPIFEPILDYIVENEQICRSLFENKDSSNFTNKVIQLVFEKGKQFISSKNHEMLDEEINTTRFLLSYITFGLIGIINQWFESRMSQSKSYILQISDKLVKDSISGVFTEMKKNDVPDAALKKENAPDTTLKKDDAPDTALKKDEVFDTALKKDEVFDMALKKDEVFDTALKKDDALDTTLKKDEVSDTVKKKDEAPDTTLKKENALDAALKKENALDAALRNGNTPDTTLKKDDVSDAAKK